MKYIAVYHNWWMDSGFFESEIIEADSFDDAKMKADAYAHRNSHTFNHCRAVVLELRPNEYVIRRRLTWRERLSGYISGKLAYPGGGE